MWGWHRYTPSSECVDPQLKVVPHNCTIKFCMSNICLKLQRPDVLKKRLAKEFSLHWGSESMMPQTGSQRVLGHWTAFCQILTSDRQLIYLEFHVAGQCHTLLLNVTLTCRRQDDVGMRHLETIPHQHTVTAGYINNASTLHPTTYHAEDRGRTLRLGS